MSGRLFMRKQSGNLRAQIRILELQLIQDQDLVDICATQVISNVQRQMTSPASLILAGSTGFILGEISKAHEPALLGTAEHSALRTVLSFVTLVSSVYRTLPASWTMNGSRRVFSTAAVPGNHPLRFMECATGPQTDTIWK